MSTRRFIRLGAAALVFLVSAASAARAGEKGSERTAAQASSGARDARDRTRGRFVPTVDHHQHLLSRASAAAKLPAVKLPEDLGRLVREREGRWNNSEGLAELFDEGAALFNGRRWLSGSKTVADFLADGFTGPYRLDPVGYRVDGSAGEVAGYMVEGDGTDVHFGFFHLALDKGADGAWRIKSETEVFPGPAVDSPVTAALLIKMMDEVGIRRAVVLSDAYYFGVGPAGADSEEYDKVRAENDWTAEQVAQFPGRLVAFCSFNPLRDYALAELDRCAKSRRFLGLKLHFNAAQLNFHDPEQVSKVRRVIEAANRYRLPMVIHVRPGNVYGREEAEVFLHQLVAAAPDVPVQVAHLWGGEGFSGPALAVYAEAVSKGDPAAKNLYFDISGAWIFGKPEQMAEIVSRIRQIGLRRILYASDGPPAEAWEAFRKKLPLTEAEFRVIANNVAPYMKGR